MQDRLHRQFKAAVQPDDPALQTSTYRRHNMTVPQHEIKGIVSWIEEALSINNTTMVRSKPTGPKGWFIVQFHLPNTARRFKELVNNSQTGFDAYFTCDGTGQVGVRRDPAARKAVLA